MPDALESELFIPPIDLRIQELQRHEAIKLFQKENPYISNKINKSNQTSFNTPFACLSSLAKQLLVSVVHSMNLQGPVPNMLTILPEQSLANVNAQNPIFKQYLDLINKDNDNTMLAYTDGSALKNPGPTGAGVIKIQGHKSIPVKLAKAISSKGTSFDGELAVILMATQYALTHLTKEHDSFNIYSDCRAAICAINNTISLIRENLIEISLRISSIKMIYCPGHKGSV